MTPDTTDINQSKWLSVYIFYSSTPLPLLKNLVVPLIDELEGLSWISQYFFIRYFENGTHIRLRLKGQSEILDTKVSGLLNERLGSYFSGTRNNDTNDSSSKTFLFVPYVPETARYGGSQGILVAEQHFNWSSKTILSMLNTASDWNYSSAIGCAMQLHVIFAHGMKMELNEARQFFHYLTISWVRGFPGLASPSDEGNQLRIFEESYQKQKKQFTERLTLIWDILDNQTEFEDDNLAAWTNGLGKTYSQLDELARHDRLDFPEDPYVLQARKPLWSIFISYLHMTNNRLGLINRDEAFVAYLIKRSLDNIVQDEEKTPVND